METLQNILKNKPVVYVTRDIERALGISPGTSGYYIIANSTPYARAVAGTKKNVLLIKNKKLLDTRELLTRSETKKFLGYLKNCQIVVFKNTLQIEKICRDNNWRLLNPSAALGARVEEKLSQLKWLGTLAKYLPPHKIILGKNLRFKKKPFIAQFNRAHTGAGTILVESAEQIEELKKKFPNRDLRVTEFIPGPAFTVNAIVWKNKVLVGNISYQITGLKPFTDQQFATIGNDWKLATQLLSNKQNKQIRQIATDIGRRLAAHGWSGLFGIDVIVEEKTGKVFLIEINARQPASATCESQLQRSLDSRLLTLGNTKQSPKSKVQSPITIFEAHLSALLGLLPTPYSLLPITDGAQIVQRVTKKIKNLKLKIENCTVIPYPNTKEGEDLLRIQSERGIMLTPTKFNALGKRITQTMRKII